MIEEWQYLSKKVEKKMIDKMRPFLERELDKEETLLASFRSPSFRPIYEVAVLTSTRAIAIGGELGNNAAIKVVVWWDDVQRIEVQRGFATDNLLFHLKDGSQTKFPFQDRSDIDPMSEFVSRFGRWNSSGSDFRKSLEHVAKEKETLKEFQQDNWSSRVYGHKVEGKGKKVILEHCKEGELPLFVIGGGSTQGALAAFEDRCMIVKTGGMTGIMAGAAFGGRLATFHYSQVTGIEYNSGMFNGVLEILTPSYQGTANKDFWRGTNKGRNADSNDPFTLSNCLPLDKATYKNVLPQIDQLRELVSRVHAPKGIVLPAETASSSLADQLRELASLRDEGLLTEEEFAEQKRKLLNR